MKFQILIELLFILLAKKKITIRQITSRFEISRRTAFRYIDALTLANLPISVTHGRNGGFFLPDEYKLKYGFFTKEEIQILKGILEKLMNEKSSSKINDCEELSKNNLLIEKLICFTDFNK